MNHLSILVIALTCGLLLAGAWFGWQLLRQNGRLLLRLDALEKRLAELEFGGADEPAGLPIDSVAPEFDLPDLAGERRTLTQFRSQSLLLIFFNPDCGFCRDMGPRLATLHKPQSAADPQPSGLNPRPAVLVITTGDAEMNRQLFREQRFAGPVLLQKGSEVATAYQTTGTPTGYLINREGKIASELAVGADALLALANGDARSSDDRASRFGSHSLTRSKLARNGLKTGASAPLFRLPRLDGGELTLEDLRGSWVLLVFSDPHCGPCELLAPQLERWHRDHPDIRVVMISRGEPKENHARAKEHGFSFPVVLQQQWEISRLYAMFATPIAYLINEAGIIVNDVAVGKDSILDLMARAEALLQDARGVVAPA